MAENKFTVASSVFAMLQEDPESSRFFLDEVRPPLSREMVGNITGEGPLTGRSPDFYREMAMALSLSPLFRATARAMPDAAWIYYTSARDFVYIYPWVSSKEYHFSDALLRHEFFRLGTLEKNPTRRSFWTDVYVDEFGKGLLTTCAVPIYDRDTFLGTVALDLTVDFLTTQLDQFQIEGGNIFIVNDRQQLMASSSATTTEDGRILSLAEILARFGALRASAVQAIPANQLVLDEGYLIMRHQLRDVPWQLYCLFKPPSHWQGYLRTMGAGDLILIVGMGVLMAAIFLNTHFRFILPSGRLVQFIMDQDRSPRPAMPKKIPAAWLPWFTKITKTFQENERLAREIRRQNELLEKRVEERTQELLEANRQLQRESEEHLVAEREKQQLRNKLQQAQKMEAIGLLAGGVAHDLNNILAGLVSYPQLLLLELAEDNPLRDSILTIQKAGERSAAIVQDLLSLARRGVIISEVISFNELVCSYIDSLEYKRLIESYPGGVLETDLATDLWNINGSPPHLSKCIMNLVQNAMEAMPDGGRVIIRTANCTVEAPMAGYEEVAAGEYILVQVIDEGVGIAPEEIEHVFEPFYTKKVMGRSGTGLGMAVVWGTVKDHHGSVQLESEPGRVTTISLYFPITRKERPERPADVDVHLFRGRGELILFVDDVVEQREVGCRMLRLLGYRVAAVASGEAAIRYVRDHAPDLIVLDMIMGQGLDGYETYRRIVALRPGQKAVITSGFSENERVRGTMELGAGAYVRKPYRIEQIAAAVRQELDRAG
ncbi:MAG: ATP-binding protein [Desulfopila sp.]